MRSQLRQDLVSGDWIVVAPGRGKRPHELIKKPEKRKKASKVGCPFENPEKSGHQKPFLIYGDGGWRIQVLENRYPAFFHKNVCASILKNGPYFVTEGAGHHDLVITRDHNKNFPRLSKNEARQVLEAFRDRYLMLLNDYCLAYILILHNWG